jgi:hypothetical protein
MAHATFRAAQHRVCNGAHNELAARRIRECSLQSIRAVAALARGARVAAIVICAAAALYRSTDPKHF